MDINAQIRENRRRFRVEHYDMAISEYLSRYKNDEISLNPPYQRLFRWDITTQSALIESILIGLPLPPIFVLQNSRYIWEVIDGLQRTKTLVNFVEKDFRFEGCEILSTINGLKFSELPIEEQRLVKNSRIRIEIVEENDDVFSQYLLFNRLNSNGEQLEPQEIRNFLIYKLNNGFYNKIQSLGKENSFTETLGLKTNRIEKQDNIEYLVKFFLQREFAMYDSSIRYKDLKDLITNEISIYLKKYNNDPNYFKKEYIIFIETFKLIHSVFGDNAFRYKIKNLNSIANTFSLAIGVSFIIDKLNKMNDTKAHMLIKEISNSYFESEKYNTITTRGYSPTKRLVELSQFAKEYFEEAINAK